MTSPTRVRSFSRTRWLCTAAVRSRDGIGALCGLGVAVRKHDDVRAERDGLGNLLADLVEGGLESRAAFVDREQAVDGESAEAGRLAVLVDIEQLGQVVVVDDRVRAGRSGGTRPARARAGCAPARPWPRGR